jgi:hypothetical protein
MRDDDIREEFTVMVMREDIGFEISLCGLCGNCGIVDTRESVKWNQKNVGLIGYCVCANGRALKKSKPNMLVKDMEDTQERMARRLF